MLNHPPLEFFSLFFGQKSDVVKRGVTPGSKGVVEGDQVLLVSGWMILAGENPHG